MRAEILSVGTELLLGHITDTNATYLAQQLAGLGIDLLYVSTIGDNSGRLTEAVRRGHERSDLVVMTGGLGPTEDDLARGHRRDTGRDANRGRGLSGQAARVLRHRGITMPESNTKQAWTLPSVTILANPLGTAPGWWAERDGKGIVAMPGVPHEMTRMWEHEVAPRLRAPAILALHPHPARLAWANLPSRSDLAIWCMRRTRPPRPMPSATR